VHITCIGLHITMVVADGFGLKARAFLEATMCRLAGTTLALPWPQPSRRSQT
jgi:hypothetical protein